MKDEMEYHHGWDAPAAAMPYERARRSSESTVSDLISEYTRLNMLMLDRMSRMAADALEPAKRREPKGSEKRRWHEDECGDPCHHDPCHCRCCIGDADFVAYARLGERRLLPIRLENHRRREREISLELSDWTTRSGKKVALKAEILPETKFKLEACGEKEIILAVELAQAAFDPAGNVDTAAGRARLPDVDDCTVLYADLRVEGCEVRPLRFALAILPRDCYPFEIHCRCSCCHD